MVFSGCSFDKKKVFYVFFYFRGRFSMLFFCNIDVFPLDCQIFGKFFSVAIVCYFASSS